MSEPSREAGEAQEAARWLAERWIDNGECGAQTVVADVELRESLVRNVAAGFLAYGAARERAGLERAARAVESFAWGAPFGGHPARKLIEKIASAIRALMVPVNTEERWAD